MKIRLICVGKTESSHINQGLALYQKRLKHYIPFEILALPDIRSGNKLPIEKLKIAEGKLLLTHITNPANTILLDDKGKLMTSHDFSDMLQKKMNCGLGVLDFVIGGAYGFSEEIYQQINSRLSFSRMTFSHELIRLIFSEQLYRAMTILSNVPYHHE